MEREWLARRLERGASYEAIAREAGCSASTVSAWAKRYGLRSLHTDRHRARGAMSLEALEALVADHASVRDIARALDRSPTTVRHWLKRYGLESPAARRRAEGTVAREVAAVEAVLTCPLHGPTRHVRRDRGFRCTECRTEYVSARRRRVKQILVDEAGGACVLCGYERCVAALHFHHVEPETKSFALGAVGVTLSLEAARAEARKCVVLCANCHAEVESGLADVPVGSPPPRRLYAG